jgi:pimeloyl-[acyl-carrier protein] synthase
MVQWMMDNQLTGESTDSTLDLDLIATLREKGDGLLSDLDRIRNCEPVFWSEKNQCWFLTTHADVSASFLRKLPVTNADRMWAVFRSIPESEWEARIPNFTKYSQLWVTSTEGAQHQRLRRLFMKALNRQIVEEMRPYARARAEFLLDPVTRGEPVEFNETVSRQMTGDVLFKLLGIPDDVIPRLREWASGLMEAAGSVFPTPEQLERADWALAEMNKVVVAEIEKRKIDPKPDLITALYKASEDDLQPLTVDEICAQMHVAIVAGHDTTMNTLTLSVAALAEHPWAWDYIHSHQDRMPDIVAELQRYVAMSGGQARLVTEDFELHGHNIREGQMLLNLILTANRDPAVFNAPDRLDFERDNRAAMMFAPGVHFCLGHLLAKMQLAEFLTVLIQKAKGATILDEKLDWMPIWVFRGLGHLNVRFTPRTN